MLDKLVFRVAGENTGTIRDAFSYVGENHPLLVALRQDQRIRLGQPVRLDAMGQVREIQLRAERNLTLYRTGIYVSERAHGYFGIRYIVNPHPELNYWIYHDMLHHLNPRLVNLAMAPVNRFDLCFDDFSSEIHSVRQFLTFDRRTKTYKQYLNQHGEIETIELGSLKSFRQIKIYNKAAEMMERSRNPLPDYYLNERESDLLLEGDDPYHPENFAPNPCTRFECVFQQQHARVTNVHRFYDLIQYVCRIIYEQPLPSGAHPFENLRMHEVDELPLSEDSATQIIQSMTKAVWKASGLHQTLFDPRLKWHSGIVQNREAATGFRLHSSRPTTFNGTLRVQLGTNRYLLEQLAASLRTFFLAHEPLGRRRLDYYNRENVHQSDNPAYSFGDIVEQFAALHRRIRLGRASRFRDDA